MKRFASLTITTLILTALILSHLELKGSDPFSATAPLELKVPGTFSAGARDQLQKNILPFWLAHSIDTKNGGFVGEITNNNIPKPDTPKGLVLNARILWTFSAAHLFDSRPAYVKTATRAYDYFTANFLDPQHGGAYWLLDHQGTPLDDSKELYGQSFAVYALTEYYRATGRRPAIEKAIALYQTIQQKCHDPVNKGYRETFARDWTPAPNARLAYGQQNATKTMNTHLHLLEAYTNLYRVYKSPQLKASLTEMIELFRDRIIDHETRHFKLFFDDQWNATSETISFGHDIEGSWLLTEAAEVLGDPALIEQIEEISIKMAEACYNDALDTDGSLFYEAEPQGISDPQKSWWAQAETTVGFLNAYQLTGQDKYYKAAKNNWQFILNNLVDTEYGEWFSTAPKKISNLNSQLSNQTVRPPDNQNKASQWKAPYHNARACIEIVRRLRP